MKSQYKFIFSILTVLTISFSSEAKVFTVDTEYQNFHQFRLFKLQMHTDDETKRKSFRMVSRITESTMRTGQKSVKKSSIKEHLSRMHLYLDGNEEKKPDVDMDLKSLNLAKSPPVTAGGVRDGRIVDSLTIVLNETALDLFKKEKPSQATAVFYDKDGKIACVASVYPPDSYKYE